MTSTHLVPRALRALLAGLAMTAAAGCLFSSGGYDADDPTKITCACGDGVACYEGASDLASRQGENAETGEHLLYLAQCACFQGTIAGCNTLSHFASDFVTACDAGQDVRDACAIAGYVHEHGVRVPAINGRSFPRDAAAAASAFRRACDAGASVVCRGT